MSVERGTTDQINFKRGSTDINKINRGSTIVWQRINIYNMFIAGTLTDGVTHRKYNTENAISWSRNHTADLWDIKADNDGNVIVGGDRTTFGTRTILRKYNSAGTLLWSFVRTVGAVYGLDYDNSGNIYIAGTPSFSHAKFNSNGVLQWNADYGFDLYDVAVDRFNADLYVVGARVSNASIVKYNTLSDIIFTRDHGAETRCVTVDSSRNFYVGGLRNSNIGGTNATHRKYNSAGTLLWSADHGAQIEGIAVDTNGNVYVSGARTSSITLRKYNSDGTLLWSRDTGGAFGRDVAVDPDGFVYVVFDRNTNIGGVNATHTKLDSDGNTIWRFDNGQTIPLGIDIK